VPATIEKGVAVPNISAQFVPWTGGFLLIGRAEFIPQHAHSAIKLAFGSTRGIRIGTGERWVEYGGALIPSRQPHSIDATGVETTAMIFVEPETPQGRLLAQRYLRNGVASLPDDILGALAPALFDAAEASDGESRIVDACQRLLHALTGNTEHEVAVDRRVSRAISYINANLHDTLTLERIASEACLSPGRFRHLFVEETSMALREYILWRRFVKVWELLNRGATLSNAAHTAGFADAAHLSRTSRKFFGFPPSALQLVPTRITVAAPLMRVVPTAFNPRPRTWHVPSLAFRIQQVA
jgi:AraC family transcriptional regulator